jgi:preprotein translocase subunit SecG
VNASGAHASRGPGGFLAASGGGSVTLQGLRATDNSAAGKTKIRTHFFFLFLFCLHILLAVF